MGPILGCRATPAPEHPLIPAWKSQSPRVSLLQKLIYNRGEKDSKMTQRAMVLEESQSRMVLSYREGNSLWNCSELDPWGKSSLRMVTRSPKCLKSMRLFRAHSGCRAKGINHTVFILRSHRHFQGLCISGRLPDKSSFRFQSKSKMAKNWNSRPDMIKEV